MRRITSLFAAAVFAAVPMLAAAQVEHTPASTEAPAIAVVHASPAPSASPSAAPHVASFVVQHGAEPQPILVARVQNRVELDIHRASCSNELCISERYVTHNARVNAGANAIAAALGNGVAVAFQYIALSPDTTAVSASDATCTSEISGGGLARKSAAYAFVSGPASLGSTSQYTLTASWTATASETVNKLCAFSASSGGTLGFETLLGSTVSLNSGDSANLTWTYNV